MTLTRYGNLHLWCPVCEEKVPAYTDGHVLLCPVDDGHCLLEELA